MKKLFLIIIFIFISCDSKMSLEKKYEVGYILHIEENNKYIESLIENIKLKMSQIENVKINQNIKICDSLSKEYFNYLTTIEEEIKEQGNEIFFEGEYSYSEKGKTYVEKTKKYKSEIEKLSNSENFIKRLNLVFSMKTVRYKNMGINYIDYYFKGFPKIQTSSFISDQKSRVLEFENEIITETFIAIK